MIGVSIGQCQETNCYRPRGGDSGSVRHGVLAEPENPEALADGIWRLWRDPILRAAISRQQAVDVEEYEMMSVTRRFLHEVSRTTG